MRPNGQGQERRSEESDSRAIKEIKSAVLGENEGGVKDGFICEIWQMEEPIPEMRDTRGGADCGINEQ